MSVFVVLVGVVLVLLKYMEVGSFGKLSWWWVSVPFIIVVIIWEVLTPMFGWDKKKEHEDAEREKQKRISKKPQRAPRYRYVGSRYSRTIHRDNRLCLTSPTVLPGASTVISFSGFQSRMPQSCEMMRVPGLSFCRRGLSSSLTSGSR